MSRNCLNCWWNGYSCYGHEKYEPCEKHMTYKELGLLPDGYNPGEHDWYETKELLRKNNPPKKFKYIVEFEVEDGDCEIYKKFDPKDSDSACKTCALRDASVPSETTDTTSTMVANS